MRDSGIEEVIIKRRGGRIFKLINLKAVDWPYLGTVYFNLILLAPLNAELI